MESDFGKVCLVSAVIPLEPTHYYHIYNHANGFEKLFVTAPNYHFFMDKYRLFVSPYVNTYCFCLMPNHIHFLVQIRTTQEIEAYLKNSRLEKAESLLTKFQTDPEKFMSKQFSNLFSSYTQSFNKQQHRMGSLFMKNFKRRPVLDEIYLKKLVHYIHNNPVEAGLCAGPDGWSQSSYNSIVNSDSGFVKRGEVIDWFDDVEGFKAFHKLPSSLEDVD